MTPEAPLLSARSTIRCTVFGMSATLKSQMTSERSESSVIISGPAERTRGQFILIASTVPETESATESAFSRSVSSSASMTRLLFFI